VAASLADRLAALTFIDQTAEAVTVLLIDAVAAWAIGQGWRVYRRAPSVATLPPPYAHQHSYLDMGCARPEGPPIAVEVDRTDRRRTVDNLLAEAAAGRVAVWIRWGSRHFNPPPPPVTMVTCHVTSHPAVGKGRLYSRSPAAIRPALVHMNSDVEAGEQANLF
jgi:hypothetical protein